MSKETASPPPQPVIHIHSQVETPQDSNLTSSVPLYSPLTPTAATELSTPQEPRMRRSLLSLFDDLDLEDEDSNGICYDLDGDGPPVALELDSSHHEASCDDLIPGISEDSARDNFSTLPTANTNTPEFVPRDDSYIMGLKVGE